MSRCFPFPPPGYENKARPNDLNLIIKEKDKHKKHKKDKDKKGRSERKDKERAEGKHEDKDRKQKKHKNKKEKQKSSEENKIVRPPSENQNGEKPVPYNKLGNGWHDNGNPVELGKRIGNGDGAMDEKRRFLEEKKIINHPENRNSEKLDPGYKSGDGAHCLVEMGKRISNSDKKELKRKYSEDEDKISGLHLENRIDERPGPYNNPGDGGRNHIILVEQKTDNMKEKHKSYDDINIAGPSKIWNSENAGPYNKPGYGAHEHRVSFEMEERVRADDCATYNSYPIMSGHNWVDNFTGEKRINVENIPSQANSFEKKSEGKEKTKLGNSVGEGDGLENKNRDKNKEDKKRKREDKVKSKERKIQQRASDRNLLDLCTDKPVDLLKESWDKRGKLPELKEQFTLNGFLREENVTLPDNLSRPAISSCQVGQNGNGVHQPCHKNTIIPLDAEKRHALIMNHRVNGSKLPSSPKTLRACMKNHDVGKGSHLQNGRRKDNKERGVNGVLEGNKVISPSPSIAKDLPPHPDLKYLSEILIDPKIEHPIFTDNDEEWLFGCKDAKRVKCRPFVVECSERVWSDAIRLEAADVVAMPSAANEGSSRSSENSSSGNWESRLSSGETAGERQWSKVHAEVLRSYDELGCKVHRLEDAKNKITSYKPGSWTENKSRYDVPDKTSLLLIGPKGSGKSSLVNKISRVLEENDFLSERAQVLSGGGTLFLGEYRIPRGSGSFSLYDTRGLSVDVSENWEMLRRWMTEGVRHGEVIKRPVVVFTHGDLMSLSDRVKVRVYLGKLLGVPPTSQIFDVPENNDSATSLAILDMLTFSLEHADWNLPVKRKLFVGKVYFVACLHSWMILAIAIFWRIFGFCTLSHQSASPSTLSPKIGQPLAPSPEIGSGVSTDQPPPPEKGARLSIGEFLSSEIGACVGPSQPLAPPEAKENTSQDPDSAQPPRPHKGSHVGVWVALHICVAE